MFMQPPVQMGLSVNSRDLAEVETILNRAIIAGDPLIATEYGNQLTKSIARKGVALAKLFFGMRKNWALFRAAGIEEDFPDFVDANMLYKGKTAEKYANMFEAVFENEQVPLQVKEQLENKSIKTLLLLTAAVREGELDVDQLGDVVILDHEGVHRLVRDARGNVTNSSARVYARLVQRESTSYPKGTLVVFGDNEIEPIGYVNLFPKTEAGRKFLERMKNTLALEDIR